MLLRGLILMSTCSLIGCGGQTTVALSPTPPATTPPATTPDRERLVLLRGDAALYSEPGAAQPVIDERDHNRSRDRPNHTRVFRLIDDSGEWLTVESMGNISPFTSNTCHGKTWSLRGMKLRFHVRRDDIFPVLTKPVQATYPDGTAVSLKPGVALGPADRSGNRWIHVHWLELRMKIADGFIGLSYEPVDMFETLGPDNPRALVLNSRVFRDEALFFANGRVIGPKPLGKNVVSPIEYVSVIEDRGDDRLIELSKPCIKVRALAATKYASDLGAAFAGILGSINKDLTGFQGTPRAAQGSSIFWRGGRSAGTVVKAIGFHDEVETDGDRRCFRISTRDRYIEGPDGRRRTEPVRFLELCFDPAAIIDK